MMLKNAYSCFWQCFGLRAKFWVCVCLKTRLGDKHLHKVTNKPKTYVFRCSVLCPEDAALHRLNKWQRPFSLTLIWLLSHNRVTMVADASAAWQFVE